MPPLNKWLWDPIAPAYNALVTAINSLSICALGRSVLTPHISQKAALRWTQAAREVQCQQDPLLLEWDGLMKTYGAQNAPNRQLKSEGQVFALAVRDVLSPLAGALEENVRTELSSCSLPTTSTPWTGMVGCTNDGQNTFVGRIANDKGRMPGWVEVKLALHPDQNTVKYKLEAAVALLVHAWLFRGHHIDGHPINYFTLLVRQDRGFDMRFAEQLDAEEIDRDKAAKVYGVQAKNLDPKIKIFAPHFFSTCTVNGMSIAIDID